MPNGSPNFNGMNAPLFWGGPAADLMTNPG
jgi:hypothetical protein